jgi:lactobin A/cerein 7B family class IIb bacteriocin
MKNLEIMGVQEMDASEMKNVDGGFIAAMIAIAIAGWGIANLIHDCFVNHEQLDITSW